MFKFILIFIVSTFLANCSTPVLRSNGMVEFTIVNSDQCKLFLGITEKSYSADSSINQNQPFIISSSACDGMLIKSNNEFIKFSTVRADGPHKEFLNIELSEGAVHLPTSDCSEVKHRPGAAGYICASADGKLWWFSANGSKREF